MIKVIASDMDGTLLGDNHKVAPETVEAIREAQAAGIRFMIATGRSYNGAMEELKGLDLGCDFIVGSAAAVYSVWKKFPVPFGVLSITIIVNGSKRIPEHAERTMSCGDLPSVFCHKPTSDKCTRE